MEDVFTYRYEAIFASEEIYAQLEVLPAFR
jgi:hypothetical protein